MNTKVFKSVEDANAAAMMDTTAAATKAGLTEQLVDDGHIICQKPGTMELVDVFPDGTWEYQNVNEDGEAESMSGNSAALLALYLASSANKEKFQEELK